MNEKLFSEAGFNAAVSDALGAAGPDTVHVAAGTIDLTGGLSVSSGQEIDIVGAGAGQTILESDTDGPNYTMMAFQPSGVGSELSDMTLRFTGAPTGTRTVLVLGGGATGRNLRLEDDSSYNGTRLANVVSGSTLTQSRLELNSSSDQAYSATSGNSNVSDTEIVGDPAAPGSGINFSGSTHNLDRVTISGIRSPVSIDVGTVNVRDTLIDLGTITNSTAISIANFNNSMSTITGNVERVTVIGSGNNQTGARVEASTTNPAGENSTLNITDSIIAMTGTSSSDLSCGSGDSPSVATLNSTRVLYDDFSTYGTTNCTAHNDVGKIDRLVTPPSFISAGTGDYRPTFDSPAVDAGGDGTGLAVDAVDRGGRSRLVDGNNNGTANVDLGAFEYQRAAPQPLATVLPTSVAVGESVAFSATGSDLDGESLTFNWNFSDGGSSASAATNRSFNTPGTYSGTVTATDPVGLTGTSTGTVVVKPPVVTVVAKPKKAFSRKGKHGFKLTSSSKNPFIGLDVADASSLRLKLERVSKGRRKSGKCQKGTGRPRCTLYTKVRGTPTLAVAPGATKLIFGGKFGRMLRAGTYRVTLTPETGGFSGKPVSVNFKLK